MPWQNPLGTARGPRHTAVQCHCRYRGTVCGKGEVLNLLTPRNKNHCENLLPLLFWFPRYKWAMFLWLIRSWSFKTKRFLFFFLGKLFQFTQVIKRKSFKIMMPKQSNWANSGIRKSDEADFLSIQVEVYFSEADFITLCKYHLHIN